jgi:hypothetical protein
VVLQSLQNLLGDIYDVPVTHDVSEFLLTDRERLPAAVQETGTDEQVLVAEDSDTVWINLYLEPGVLERLASADPLHALHDGNIADYWTALEGVSHFVYLAWAATHDRSVTLLELELQAEVDKYVSSVWLMQAQDPKRFPVELHQALFERSSVDSVLAGDRVELYREANRYAARFCRRLAHTLRPGGGRDERAAAIA